MSTDQEKFQQLKESIDTKKEELSKAKGKYEAAKNQAEKEFETSDIKELENLKEQKEQEEEELQEEIDNLTKEIEDELDEMEDS